jgi:hypothetical protein
MNPFLLYLVVLGAVVLLHIVLVGLLLWTGHCRYSFKESWRPMLPGLIAVSVGFWGGQLLRLLL